MFGAEVVGRRLVINSDIFYNDKLLHIYIIPVEIKRIVVGFGGLEHRSI